MRALNSRERLINKIIFAILAVIAAVFIFVPSLREKYTAHITTSHNSQNYIDSASKPISKSKLSCSELNRPFYSYSEAIYEVKRAEFILTDELPYGKSSWIRSAKFYSCDGIYGYMIFMNNNGKEYIHKDLPLFIWNRFKFAESSGSYYNRNIKGRYRFSVGF